MNLLHHFLYKGVRMQNVRKKILKLSNESKKGRIQMEGLFLPKILRGVKCKGFENNLMDKNTLGSMKYFVDVQERATERCSVALPHSVPLLMLNF